MSLLVFFMAESALVVVEGFEVSFKGPGRNPENTLEVKLVACGLACEETWSQSALDVFEWKH